MKRFTIDARKITSFEDFVAATNLGFVGQVGGRWNGNLNAFNDYLSWPDDEEYELELLGAANCREQLGHAAQATLLREYVRSCHPSNVPELQSRLARAAAGEGETLFDVILGIVADNLQVRLVLR